MNKLEIIDIGQLWSQLGLNIGDEVSAKNSNLSIQVDYDGDSIKYKRITIRENDNIVMTLGRLTTVYVNIEDECKLTLVLRQLTIKLDLILNKDESND